MEKKYNVAILGATGLVGGELLKTLEKRNFSVNNLKLLASVRSRDKKIKFKDELIKVEEVTNDSFKNIDIVLASSGQDTALQFANAAVKSGACFIDNSNAFRMDKDVPLVVPEVNGEELKKHKGVIANPNCSTSQLVPVLKVLNDIGILKRVIVSTYQSVSGAGLEAMEELSQQTGQWLSKSEITKKIMPKQIAFNLIPHIDAFLPNGYTKEEMKVVEESRKILNLPDLPITCTAVRVPVMIGHSESVTVDLEKNISLDTVKKALSQHELIEVVDDPNKGEYMTPLEAALTDPVYVSRIRKDTSSPNGYNMWVVSDNLKIGAALNAVKIAEYLIKNDLLAYSKV